MNNGDDDRRPSPEALLKLAQAEEKLAGKGRLKIFLGYAAGVGKTFAMLEAAWQRRLEGRTVVAAYVESHGRFETDSLLAGLEIIPKVAIDYQGVLLQELDIDAVIARKPQIALVDELAHTNAPSSRHEKRWQDVEELLAAGIDVYSTVNVQHFESLNDIVAQITGVTVRETVPDRLLDEAYEVRLVDIPPDDLLQRLKEGKIYIPEQAAQAMEKFFQPGNLLALRELSLRRTATRVDDEMRAYMETRSIAGPWPTAERLLVCVSGSPYSEKLIRSTRRLAEELKSPWHTVYIETPDSGRHARQNRERIWRDLRLAESLGGEVATLSGSDVAATLLDFALRHNVTKIVVGKPARPRWQELFRHSVVDRLIRSSGVIDLVVVSFTPEDAKPRKRATRKKSKVKPLDYLKSLVLVAAVTFVSNLIYPYLDPTNLAMLYLLGVVLAATRLGLRPAILTAFLSVVAFDFFFVPPRFSFRVSDTEYLITFAGLFTVSVVISTLVARARERAETVRLREVQTASLYYLSRDLAAAADCQTLLDAVVKNIAESLNARVVMFVPEGERLDAVTASAGLTLDVKEQAVADWAFRNRQPAGRGTETLGSAGFLYLPLQTAANILGVIGVSLEDEADYRSEQLRRLLDAFATQTAMAMERVQLARQAGQAELLQARENLERALLNSISHDLRTPLVTITGVLTSLRDEGELLSEAGGREMIDTAWGEAERLNRFVGNLLDMTRLEAGALTLKLAPCDLQDLVGCALAATEQRLAGRKVDVDLAPELPPVAIDLVLMTQVLVNLLDNAVKYSPPSAPIEVHARADNPWLIIEVTDHGPGVPDHDLKRVFDKFYRIPVPEGAGGTGLGLSISKGIVAAHHGRIHAENRSGGGLRVVILLPLWEDSDVSRS